MHLKQTLRRLKHTVKQSWQRMFPGTVILLYHRITRNAMDPQLLCVSPEHFREHLQILQQSYRVVRLSNLFRKCSAAESLKKSVIITFDDGYSDNLSEAKPLLETFQTPATVFVTTGYLKQAREFWWDALEQLLLLSGSLPDRLTLSIQHISYTWDLAGATHYRQQDYVRHLAWNVLLAENPTPRHHIYRTLCALLKPLAPEERESLVNSLYAWAGVRFTNRPTHRGLTAAEVNTLGQGRFLDVGAHGMTHVRLASQSRAQQTAEISTSKTMLEDILQRPVASFSYPYGASTDYTPETIALVKEAGFQHACANIPGRIQANQHTPRFELPRMLVRDWAGDEFANYLRAWFLE